MQFWWYLSSLWRTTNSHRTSRWWFQCFFVLPLPTWGNDQVGWIYDLRKSLFIWSQWGSCVWKSSLWRARPKKDGGELPVEGTYDHFWLFVGQGRLVATKKENIDLLYKFTDSSPHIINRMNTMIGIYRWFRQQLSAMLYFQNLLTPVLSPPEKAFDP